MIEKVCVIGLGTVGLPTALHVSKFYDVTGYDKNIKAVKKANKLGLDATFKKIPYADLYVITVSTNIKKDNSPDMSNIYDVSNQISKFNSRALICIESTVSLGTCRKLAEKYFFEKIVHCPHRYWSGDTINHGVVQTRVFGALNDVSSHMGKIFYKRQAIPIIEVSSIEIAEMSKFAENAYRFVQIAFAEELKLICDNYELSFEEVKKACNTKWNIEILEAKDGIGGHCLPKDIRYLWIMLKSPLLNGAIKADEIYKKIYVRRQIQ